MLLVHLCVIFNTDFTSKRHCRMHTESYVIAHGDKIERLLSFFFFQNRCVVISDKYLAVISHYEILYYEKFRLETTNVSVSIFWPRVISHYETLYYEKFRLETTNASVSIFWPRVLKKLVHEINFVLNSNTRIDKKGLNFSPKILQNG